MLRFLCIGAMALAIGAAYAQNTPGPPAAPDSGARPPQPAGEQPSPAGNPLLQKVETCFACHGENGVPVDATIPVIAGQHQGYLYLQLRDFKLGNRKNDIMNPMAADMPREEMMALAEFFSHKSWPNLNQPRAAPDAAKRAEVAIVAGQCQVCHGEQGMGDSTNPRITGQGRDYIFKTVTEFRDKVRTNNPWMSDILRTLQPEDLSALADFYAGR